MTNPPDDLTEGWPTDPANEELARFARELQAARPVLPDKSLAWVEQTMRQELARRPEPLNRRPIYAGLATAALLAIGVGLYLWLKPTPPLPIDPPPVVDQRPVVVEDRYTVELAAPPAPVQIERSLVRLDEHRSLFTD